MVHLYFDFDFHIHGNYNLVLKHFDIAIQLPKLPLNQRISLVHSTSEIGFKIIKIRNPDNSVLLSELRSDRLETIQTDSVSLRFSFVRLYYLFRTFSYVRPNFPKISAQTPNFSPDITIHLNIQFSSNHRN